MSPIEKMIRDAVKEAIFLNLITRPAQFRRELEIRSKRTGSDPYVCSGGIAKKPGTKDWMREAVPVIKLGSKWLEWDGETDTGDFEEYARIARDLEIGSMKSVGPGTSERCLALHELAHAIVWWNWYCDGRPSNDRPTGHQGIWRRCYRTLRRHYGLVDNLPAPKPRRRRAPRRIKKAEYSVSKDLGRLLSFG